MRYALLFGAVIFLQNPSPRLSKAGSPPQQQSRSAQQPTNTENRGTQDSPVFVEQLPPEKTQAETDQETQDRKDKAANDGRLVAFNGLLVLVGFLQLLVFGYQAYKLRQTVEVATAQSQDMKDSIAQAARAAKAMEDVATHFERSVAETKASTTMFAMRGQMQMRAYICAEVGTAILRNTGVTPAHNVRFRVKADILPFPIPNDFDFPLPSTPIGGSLIGPHQTNTITGIVEDFVPDEQIVDIKNVTAGKVLCLWGVVSYEDVFKDTRVTEFCQILSWLPNGSVVGTYIDRHNDAN